MYSPLEMTITKLDVGIICEQDILTLDVTMDDLVLVQVAEALLCVRACVRACVWWEGVIECGM